MMTFSLKTFRILVIALGAFLLWVGILVWPAPPSLGLDVSWEQVLGYAHTQGLSYGHEIVFTYGPWGWLGTRVTEPAVYWPRFIWEIFFKGLFVSAWVFAARRLPFWRSVLAWLFALLLLPFFPNTQYTILIVGPLLWLNLTPARPLRWAAVVGAWVGFLAMHKFTYFMMAAWGVGGISACLWLRSERVASLSLIGSCVFSLIVSWLAAGQDLADLPVFLRQSLELARIYEELMIIKEGPAVFWAGIGAVFLALVLTLLITLRSKGSRLTRCIFATVCVGFLFLSWKHGFVRADGHVLALFYFTITIAILCPRFSYLGLPLIAISLFGIYSIIPAGVKISSIRAWGYLQSNYQGLLHPYLLHDLFLANTAKAAEKAALPRARQEIGRATVDVLGHGQSSALLNQLNYRPRPVFQSYQACSLFPATLNANYFSGPKAPDFVLAKMESIDGRLPALDDAFLIPILLANYRYVAQDSDFLILRREKSGPLPPPRELLRIKSRLKETIVLPRTDTPLWLTVQVHRTLPGRLSSFLYKPRSLSIRITLESGQAHDFQFKAIGAAGGFLLTPFLPNTEYLKQWYVSGKGENIRSIAIRPERKSGWFFQEEIELVFFSLPLSPP